MPQPVVSCPSCHKRTPARHAKCVYCAKPLPAGLAPKGDAAHEEPRMLGGEKARFVRKSDDKTHYLVCDFHDPVTMTAGQLFVIGRDPHTSLEVRAPDVSRQHAEIDWDGADPPRPILREVRSSAGTFLNDKKVERADPQPLRSGDRIRLGAATVIHYLHVTERDLKKEIEERAHKETKVFDGAQLKASLQAGITAGIPEAVPARGATTPTGGLRHRMISAAPDAMEAQLSGSEEVPGETGSFEQVAPPALIKRLHDEKASGVLTFFVEGSAPGEVVLVEGRCKDAIIGLYTGREAVEVLAGMDQGAYRFRREAPDRLRVAPPSAEVDAQGLALSGFLDAEYPGESLLQDLVSQRSSGVLTVWDGGVTGEITLRSGICQASLLGARRGREALDYVRSLEAGAYRFRPEAPAGGTDLPPTQQVRSSDLEPPGSAGGVATEPPWGRSSGRRRAVGPPSGSGRVERAEQPTVKGPPARAPGSGSGRTGPPSGEGPVRRGPPSGVGPVRPPSDQGPVRKPTDSEVIRRATQGTTPSGKPAQPGRGSERVRPAPPPGKPAPSTPQVPPVRPPRPDRPGTG